MKKVSFFVISFFFVLNGLAHDFVVNNIYYNITSNKSPRTVSVTYMGTSSSSAKYSGSVTIPSEVYYEGNYYTVTEITSSAFYNCKQLTSITLPVTIQSAASNAFTNCTGLKTVTINCLTAPSCFNGLKSIATVDLGGVKKIVKNAFAKCTGLKNLFSGYSLEDIGESAFSGCTGLTAVDFPSSLTQIGASAFADCSNLEALTIPSSVTTIGNLAFQNCTKMASLTIESGTTPLKMAEGSNSPFKGCTALHNIQLNREFSPTSASPFSVLSSFKVACGYSLSNIQAKAFYNCTGLTEIDLGRGVSTIGTNAFYGCTGLTAIDIPRNITSIASNVFTNCKALKTVSIDSENVGTWFKGLSYIQELTLGPNVQKVASSAFGSCTGLLRVTINTLAPTIEASAFSGCKNLGAVTLHCNSVGSWFKGLTSLKTVVTGDETGTIGNNAFYGCTGLTSVTLGPSVTNIGEYAFYNCTGLQSISIPESDFASTTIKKNAFRGCTSLTHVDIPNLTEIQDYAFSNCSALQSFYIPYSFKKMGTKVFSGCNSIKTLTFNCQEVNTWFQKMPSVTSITIMDAVNTIRGSAFYGCTGLKELNLGHSVKSISTSAFFNCKNLESLLIPSSVTSIASSAFSFCTGLKEINVESGNTIYDSRDNCNAIIRKSSNVLILGCLTTTIPRSVTGLGEYAFSGCGFTSFELPKQISSMGAGVFRGCRTISDFSVETGNSTYTVPDGSHAIMRKSTKALVAACPKTVIPEGTTAIQDFAFYAMHMTSLILPESVISLGANALAYNDFSYIYLPESINTIGAYCFYGCTNLKEATIPRNVTAINDLLFLNCTALEKVILPRGVTELAQGAFGGCNILKDVYCYAEQKPERGGSGISGSEETTTLHVPENAVETYKADLLYSDFAEIVPIKSYSLSYKIEGKIILETDFMEGEVITDIPMPEKEGYTFSGWRNLPTTMPAANVVATGSYTVNKYNVTFKYGDTVLSTQAVEYGAAIPLPESLDSERYTLVEWLDVPATMPAHDIIIQASFTDGVQSIGTGHWAKDTSYYDLGGRRIDNGKWKMNNGLLPKGIYIFNGRKVLIK